MEVIECGKSKEYSAIPLAGERRMSGYLYLCRPEPTVTVSYSNHVGSYPCPCYCLWKATNVKSCDGPNYTVLAYAVSHLEGFIPYLRSQLIHSPGHMNWSPETRSPRARIERCDDKYETTISWSFDYVMTDLIPVLSLLFQAIYLTSITDADATCCRRICKTTLGQCIDMYKGQGPATYNCDSLQRL